MWCALSGTVDAEPDIVIVGLDEETLARYPEPLALWHSHLGRLLATLGGLSPRLIVLDIMLPDKTYAFISPDYDGALLSGIPRFLWTLQIVEAPVHVDRDGLLGRAGHQAFDTILLAS